MATVRKQFRGAYEHVLDDKSRVIIPIKWREALGESIVLCRSLDGTECIWGFAEDDFYQFFDELKRGVPMGDLEGQKQLRLVSSSISEVEVDKQGRVPLSPKLRDHAVIASGAEARGANVIVLGMVNRFEIWNPAKYDECQTGVQPKDLLDKLDRVRMRDSRAE